MSNFDLTFCKVYIYAKGWPGINLGAWHESCAHPSLYVNISSVIPKRDLFFNGVRKVLIYFNATVQQLSNEFQIGKFVVEG